MKNSAFEIHLNVTKHQTSEIKSFRVSKKELIYIESNKRRQCGNLNVNEILIFKVLLI